MIAAGLVLILVALALSFHAGRAHEAADAQLRRQASDQFEAAMAPSRLSWTDPRL